MIELYIDNQPVEIAEGTSVRICAWAAELTAPESIGRKEYPMRIPMSPRNRVAMGFPEQALSTHLFNQGGHTGEVRCKGTVLLRGGIELLRCEVGTVEAGWYVIRLVVEPPQWIRDARIRPLRETELPFSAVLSAQWIRQGWRSDSPVKYLPVWRDRYEPLPIESLSEADYHPFVQIRALLDAIVAPSGYRIVSEFLNEPFFLSLYMSGNFPDRGEPRFHAPPGSGESITLTDIFAHPEPQIQLFQALGHLFDLHAHTDELTRTIYLEPRYSFLRRSEEIDWSDRIDLEKPIVLEEPGGDRNRIETFRYKAGDAVLERTTPVQSAPYGSWCARIRNHFADDREKALVNPLFTASADVTGVVASALSCRLIAAADRDAVQARREDEYLNFPAKIVRYLGLKELPQGERWGWPSNGTSYPLVAFHSPSEDWYTLCFDDVAGQWGLKNYHLPRYDWFNGGKILTLHLRLTPGEMEAILHPNSADRNFRSQYVFTLRGEKIRGRLAGIDGYDPAGGSTRCVFTLES